MKIILDLPPPVVAGSIGGGGGARWAPPAVMGGGGAGWAPPAVMTGMISGGPAGGGATPSGGAMGGGADGGGGGAMAGGGGAAAGGGGAAAGGGGGAAAGGGGAAGGGWGAGGGAAGSGGRAVCSGGAMTGATGSGPGRSSDGGSSSSSTISISAIFSLLQKAVAWPLEAGAMRMLGWGLPSPKGLETAAGPSRSSSTGACSSADLPPAPGTARRAHSSRVSPGHSPATWASTLAASRGSGRSVGSWARMVHRKRRTSSTHLRPSTALKSISRTRSTTSSSWASGSRARRPRGSGLSRECSTTPRP